MHAEDQHTAPGPLEPHPEDDGPTASTGDPAVDEALDRLAGLESLPVREHVAVFDAVHAALQDRLADVEG